MQYLRCSLISLLVQISVCTQPLKREIRRDGALKSDPVYNRDTIPKMLSYNSGMYIIPKHEDRRCEMLKPKRRIDHLLSRMQYLGCSLVILE